MASAPQLFRWEGDGFKPLRPKLADAAFVVGKVYKLEEVADRNPASERFYFACLREAWQNLPETLSKQFPTPEALRKRALVDAGYFDETTVDAGTQAAALRVAAFMRSADEFAVIVTRGPILVRRVAKSQSRRAMGHKEFMASKDAVLGVVAKMIGVDPEDLMKNAERAA